MRMRMRMRKGVISSSYNKLFRPLGCHVTDSGMVVLYSVVCTVRTTGYVPWSVRTFEEEAGRDGGGLGCLPTSAGQKMA